MPGAQPAELATLQWLTGLPVIRVEHCPWGFENRTDRVELADGRCVIVQRVTNAARAPARFALTRRLHAPLSQVGILAPLQLHADPSAMPPFAVYACLPGDPANRLLATDAGARTLAEGMGALLPRLAHVVADELPDTWSDPQTLLNAAQEWRTLARAFLDSESPALTALPGAIPDLFDAPPHMAHGDFCPVNALAADDRITALLDLEFARLAPPLFDAAWWGWVVRYHHPERWHACWPVLLRAAGIPDTLATQGRMQTLQRLRLLEQIASAVAYPDRARFWAARLQATLAW